MSLMGQKYSRDRRMHGGRRATKISWLCGSRGDVAHSIRLNRDNSAANCPIMVKLFGMFGG